MIPMSVVHLSMTTHALHPIACNLTFVALILFVHPPPSPFTSFMFFIMVILSIGVCHNKIGHLGHPHYSKLFGPIRIHILNSDDSHQIP